MIFQPELRKAAEVLRVYLKERADIYMADGEYAICTQCGQVFTLSTKGLKVLNPDLISWIEGVEDGSISLGQYSKKQLQATLDALFEE